MYAGVGQGENPCPFTQEILLLIFFWGPGGFRQITLGKEEKVVRTSHNCYCHLANPICFEGTFQTFGGQSLPPTSYCCVSIPLYSF